jgi:uncharacterized SAM-binding protein YcdF (DUF218 family)
MSMNRRSAWLLGFAALIILILFFSRSIWLRDLGRELVDTQPPQKSDMIVVLGGDWYGNRILKAAQLAKQGYAPKVLVSGGGYLYGNYEGDMAVPFAVQHGYDPHMFIKLLHPVSSTRAEAEAVIPELRRRGVKRYIIVTSDFHTARAGRLFREMAPDLELRVVATNATSDWDRWWEDRESRKTFLMEWTKTLTSRLGM